MLVTEIVQRAVQGCVRFDFIESTITAGRLGVLSSQKGRATSDPVEDSFQYHFVPRGALKPDWIAPGGYLDPGGNPQDVTFQLAGVEKNSANWTAQALHLKLARSSEGPVVHGQVKEWTRADQRSVNSYFVRAIVPGHIPYPTTIRHMAGSVRRGATIAFDSANIEFRDYGDYTEIAAISRVQLPEVFAERAVEALGQVLQRQLQWVYRERHEDRQRLITVRHLGDADRTVPPASGVVREYRDFWQAFGEELGSRL